MCSAAIVSIVDDSIDENPDNELESRQNP